MPTGLLSPSHIVILLIVLTLIFGPARLPEAGRALGKGLRELKDSISGAEGAEDPALPEWIAPLDEPAKLDCAACASTLPAGARFCPRCGTEVTPEVGLACLSCGSALPSGARFCEQCGAPVPRARHA
jgi:TatA/E family protein of Tat protein translocase